MKNWLLLLLCAIVGMANAQEAKWELKKDRNDVKVYVREATDSPFKELKMSFDVEASMHAIVALLQDVEAIPDWVYKCTEAYVVKEISQDEEYYYNLVDFPWPMSDRDFVVRSSMTKDTINNTLRSESWIANDMIPEKEGVVRIKHLHLWWIFTPKPEGGVHIDYYLKSDPGGYLPSWIVNMAIDQGPLQTVKRFRQTLKEPKYRNAKVAFLSE